MLEEGTTTYDRVDNSKNPFLDDPKSGSAWGLEELQWLRIQWNVDADMNTEVCGGTDQQNLYNCHLVEEFMGVEWEDVLDECCGLHVRPFYHELKELCSKRVDVFASSPPVVGNFSLQSPIAALTDSPSTRKRSNSSAAATPVKMPRACPIHTPTHPITTSESKNPAQNSLSPLLPQVLGPESARKANALPTTVVFNDSSDSTYIPSTPSVGPSVADSYKFNKREDDVAAVARHYLYLIRQLWKETHRGIEDFDITVGYGGKKMRFGALVLIYTVKCCRAAQTQYRRPDHLYNS
jgi:hypothetical protein